MVNTSPAVGLNTCCFRTSVSTSSIARRQTSRALRMSPATVATFMAAKRMAPGSNTIWPWYSTCGKNQQLTHWLLGDVRVILKCNISIHYTDCRIPAWALAVNFLWVECPRNALHVVRKSVSIGSGNGLLPNGNKPLTEPIKNPLIRWKRWNILK